MKRFYKFLMPLVAIVAMALPYASRAQDTVTIGTGTSTTSNVPFSSLWGYSFVEQVYQATAINTAGMITEVQFYLGTSATAVQTNSINLYMKNVTRSSFSTTSDFEPVTAGDIVFSGSWTIPANYTGWVGIELDTPFEYDGSSNLLVAMHEFTSGYSTRYFTNTSVTNSGVRYYSDSYNPDPYNLNSYSGSKAVISTLANMRIAISSDGISCHRVRNLTASNIGPWSCTLSWVDTSNSGATYTVLDMADSSVLATGISDTSVDLYNLTADHSYNFGVNADCGGGDESGYARLSVHTLVSCPNPTQLTVDSVTTDEITFHWTPGFEETEWFIVVGDSVIGSVADTFYTISGLDLNTVYTIGLRAVCGDGDSSITSSLTARTLAGDPISEFPYTCGFEIDEDNGTNEASDWVLENGNQTNAWYVGAPGAHSGDKGLFISNDNGTTNAYNVSSISHVFAYATFNFTDAGEYAISYDWKCQGESRYYDWLRVFLAPASADFNAGSAMPFGTSTYQACTTAVAAGWVDLNGHNTSPYTLSQSNTWQTVSTTFNVPAGTYKLVFMWSNDASGGTQPPASVDNIMITRNSCPQVSNLAATYISADSITVTWSAGGSETSWIVSNGEGTPVEVNDTTYTFDNLDANTAYTITVQAACNSDDVSLPTSINVSTLAGAPISQFPYFCGFEIDEDNEVNQAADWIIVNGTEDNYWIVGSATNNGGSNSMYITDNGTTNNYSGNASYVFTYATFVFEAGEYSYSFDWRSNGESTYDFLRAAIVPSSVEFTAGGYCGFDNSSAVPAGGIAIDGATRLNLQSSWQSKAGTFTIANQGVYKMVFMWRNDGSVYNQPPAAIDNIQIALNTCPQVQNLTAAYVGSDTVILSWQPGGEETSWEVTYDSTTTVVTDTFFIADNLSPNTQYAFSISSICGPDDASMYSTYSVRTQCGPITVLPYIESFEGLPTGSSSALDCGVPCWGRLDNASTYHFGYIGSPSSWPTGGHTGTGFLYYYMPTTTGTYADWIISILPPIDANTYPINNLQVSFWVKMNSSTTSGDIQVGVISNPSVDSTFVPLDTVHVSGDVYDLKTAYLSGYTGEGTNIALKFLRNPSTTTYYFVDDVTVEVMPDCPPVSNIVLSGIDSNMITVAWTENGTATSWNIEYGVHGFALGTGTTATISTTPTITINGLTPNTEYDVYVTPSCDGGVSATRMGTFRTANTYIALPFSCGFENAAQNALWTLENGSMTNKWYIGNATNNGGNNALYISNDNGVSNSYTISSSTVVFAYTDVMISAPGDYGYSFDWKAYGESSWDYIRVALVPVSTTLTASSSVPSGFSTTGLPAGWIALDGGSKLNLQSNWQNRTDVVSVATAGVYHLVFAWRNDGSGGTTPPAAIDNVVLAQITCARPQNVTLSNLTQTSVDVAWNEMGTATTWEWQLGNGTPVAVTDTFCSLTNLTANTAYTFRVRAICGQGDTSFWTVYDFRTPCGYVALPYIQDFEGEPTGSSTTGSAFANCMVRLNNGTSYGGYPYVSSSSTYNHTANGTYGTYWYASTTLNTYGDYVGFVLPPVDPTVGVDSLQLSFWAKASSTSYTPVFQVGVMTDPNNIATFVGIDTITLTTGTTWTLIEVPLITYTGSGQYVAIKADRPSSYWYAYVDDVVLEYLPTCLIPHNLTASSASTTSITVDWTDLSQASAWELRYSQGNGAATSVNVTYHPYTITGLDTLTSYNFEVRAICTVGDTSRWSQVAVLGTEMCDNAVVASTGSPNGTGYYTPLNNYYNYTLTETIIDSAELAGIGEITSIGYSYSYSSPSTVKTNVTIWLQPTNKTVFSSDEDMVALDTSIAVQVYSGSLNCSQGWNYFQFTNPYTWDGHSNLLVIVDDNSGDYDGSSYVFNNTSCSGYKTITWYDDDENPSPTNLSNYDGVMDYFQYRATMKLVSCGGGCPMPVISSLVPGEDRFTINYITSADSVEIAVAETFDPAATGVVVAATGSYTFTGLNYSTLYSIAVRAHCEEGAVSDWAIRNDSTLMVSCGVPTGLQATGSTYSTVTVSWTPAGDETAWSVRVYNTSYDQTYTSQTTSFTIPNLVYTEGSNYNVSVRALCGQSATIEGDWCNPITVNPDVCQPVSGITVSDITSNSAVVNWTAAQNTTGYTVQWGLGNWSSLSDAETATVSANTYTITGLDESTQYSLFVINNCTQTIASTNNQRVSFSTIAGGGGEGIADVENGSFVLSPNPASTSVTLSLNGFEGAVKVEMVDMNGRVSGNWTVTDGQLTIDLNGYAQGAYFVRVTGEQQTAVRKLIVR